MIDIANNFCFFLFLTSSHQASTVIQYLRMIFVLTIQNCPIRTDYLLDRVFGLAVFFNTSTNSFTNVL